MSSVSRVGLAGCQEILTTTSWTYMELQNQGIHVGIESLSLAANSSNSVFWNILCCSWVKNISAFLVLTKELYLLKLIKSLSLHTQHLCVM